MNLEFTTQNCSIFLLKCVYNVYSIFFLNYQNDIQNIYLTINIFMKYPNWNPCEMFNKNYFRR